MSSALCFGQPPMPPPLPTVPVAPFLLATNAHQFQNASQLFKHYTVVSHPSLTVVTQWMEVYSARMVTTTNWVLASSIALMKASTNAVPVLTPDGRVHIPPTKDNPDGAWLTVLSATNHQRASRLPTSVPSKL